MKGMSGPAPGERPPGPSDATTRKARLLPAAGPTRTRRFAFVIHPLSRQHLRKSKAIDLIARLSPPSVMDFVEKVIAHSPPFVYSRVTGIKSPTGAEAEGWLITLGGTPREIMARGPEFTYRRLLAAARMAKRMGARIMGLGAFTKVVGDSGATVARRAPLPVTTGNSYSAASALWAAREATRRLGLVEIGLDGKFKGRAMVVGATGAIGSVCSRLLAEEFEEVFLVGREILKLAALKESILKETPSAKVSVATDAGRDLPWMDLVLTCTSSGGARVLDIARVKPGCVITDVARPLDIPASDAARRPDVLVVASGEIELPGNDVRMRDIGLPPKVAHACLAETILLALEGRFESFTLGRRIDPEKAREIYKLGLKHGMKLAPLSGVNGPYTDGDILRVRRLALQGRVRSIAG